MDRILVLMSAADFPSCREAVLSARSQAACADRITFGLSFTGEPTDEDIMDMSVILGLRFLADATDPWILFPSFWQGEGFVLMGCPGMTFRKNWDIRLPWLQRTLPARLKGRGVLTGYLPDPTDSVDAVSPVAADEETEDHLLTYQKGTPLRYVTRPQEARFLHPSFCFAPAAFFTAMAQVTGPLFLGAFRQEWPLYTLHEPLIHLEQEAPVPPDVLPVQEMRSSGLLHFRQLTGLACGEGPLPAALRTGLNNPAVPPEQAVPFPVRWQHRLQASRQLAEEITPLCVTAWLEDCMPADSTPEERLHRFRHMAAIRALPLLCFSDEENIQRLEPWLPNTLRYKHRYGLPLQGGYTPEEAQAYLGLSVPFILTQAREKFLNHSHYIWVEADYLHYPVYSGAAIDWDTVCGERIIMGKIGTELDPSMITVPHMMLNDLCRVFSKICADAMEKTNTLMATQAAWEQLHQERPDWFELVEVPGRRRLFDLTQMSRREEIHTL